jgi:hypothetical protein
MSCDRASRETFENLGFVLTAGRLPDPVIAALEAVSAELTRMHPDVPHALLSGLHNPWGPGAPLVDSWTLLELCEDRAVVDRVAAVMGPDLVLWDRELLVRPRDRGNTEAWDGLNPAWPIEPAAGAAVRVAIGGDLVMQYRPGSHRGGAAGTPSGSTNVVVPPGHAALADIRLACRYDAAPPFATELVIRYMPATSRYNRDPLTPANRSGARTAPLINYSLRPLWLVRGEDRAGNDFVTGFGIPAPSWSSAAW